MNVAIDPTTATIPRDRALEREFYVQMLLDRYLWRGRHSASPRFEHKRAIVDRLHAHSGFQEPRRPDPIVELRGEELSAERFWDASEGLQRVVVIRGFNQSAATRTWTPTLLADRLAGQRCAVLVYDAETFDRGWDVGARLTQMDFGEYLRRMPDEALYINNSTELVTMCPELIDDLELPAIREALLPDSAGWDELVSTNFFIGSPRVYTSIHAAMGGNFFLQIAGRKRWTLIDPTWSAYLHPLNGRPFQYCNSAFGGFRSCARRGLVGADNPMTRLPHAVVTLEPGDLLYNAPWWWHEVENLDDFTVGCAVRHVPRPGRASPSWANHGLFTLTSTYPAMRALTVFDLARQRVTGSRRPLRDTINPLLVKRLHASLEGNRSRAERG